MISFFLYIAKYEDSEYPILLGYSSTEVFSLRMPQGNPKQSYALYIFINVTYESKLLMNRSICYQYKINETFIVIPNLIFSLNALNFYQTKSSNSLIQKLIDENKVVDCSQILISISSIFKFYAPNERKKRNLNNQNDLIDFSMEYENLIRIINKLNATNLYDALTILSALSEITKNSEKITQNSEV